MFTKRTIKPHEVVTSVDTASEALALSISEKARVDMEYMAELTGKTPDELAAELTGVIFVDPTTEKYVAADEYLSGNVREKLRLAKLALPADPKFAANVTALEAAQPNDLDAFEIEIRLGATWIDKEYIQEFMYDLLDLPYYQRRSIEVNYSEFSSEWNITGKSLVGYNNINAYMTYGTERAKLVDIRDVKVNTALPKMEREKILSGRSKTRTAIGTANTSCWGNTSARTIGDTIVQTIGGVHKANGTNGKTATMCILY